jgi:uncharacterized protein (DUF736 family)
LHVRVRVPGSEYYPTIGAAWKRTNDKSEEFLSTARPLNS